MQTVILAAGEGTRMRPLTATRPKPMLPVASKPILAHTIESAIDAGATSIVLVVGYEQSAIRAYFGEEWEGVPLTYAEQTEQRGTADAVNVAAEHLDAEPFVVLNGDALYDLPSLQKVYESGPAVGAYRVDNPSEYGVLETDGSGEAVTGIIEKPEDPPSDLINTGAYRFPVEAFDYLDVSESERGELELTDVLSKICAKTEVVAVPFERWLDIGKPWELLEANEWKLGELDRTLEGDIHEDADIQGVVVVEEGATVRSGVVIEGPALIRSGATVGPNAYVRGASLIAEGAKVGHSVEVKNSVLMGGASIGHLSYVGDSLIGDDVNFGAGTTVANLRHDGESIRMEVKGDVVSTGRRKFGCVCGPEAKTGINTSLNAGVTLEAGETTGPGETVLR